MPEVHQAPVGGKGGDLPTAGEKKALDFGDRLVVDAGHAAVHVAAGGKEPVLVAVAAPPLPGGVAPFAPAAPAGIAWPAGTGATDAGRERSAHHAAPVAMSATAATTAGQGLIFGR